MSTLANNMQDLQMMVRAVNDQSNNIRLNLNITKIKFMIVSRTKTPYPNAVLSISNQNVERISKFLYPGTILHEDLKSNVEVRRRVEMARSSYTKYEIIPASREISYPFAFVSWHVLYNRCSCMV